MIFKGILKSVERIGFSTIIQPIIFSDLTSTFVIHQICFLFPIFHQIIMISVQYFKEDNNSIIISIFIFFIPVLLDLNIFKLCKPYFFSNNSIMENLFVSHLNYYDSTVIWYNYPTSFQKI